LNAEEGDKVSVIDDLLSHPSHPKHLFFQPTFMIFSNERDDRPAHFRDEVSRGKKFLLFYKSWSKNEIQK
jgi:hypothetical protein